MTNAIARLARLQRRVIRLATWFGYLLRCPVYFGPGSSGAVSNGAVASGAVAIGVAIAGISSHHRLPASEVSLMAMELSVQTESVESLSKTDLRDEARQALRRAATYFRDELAVNGGYVYHYNLETGERWGEGLAADTQVWVQPPATPTVGLAFLSAYDATGEPLFLDSAHRAGHALIYGQLKSGGWTNSIDFDPRGRTADYRTGRGGGKNNSSLDDGQTQSALLFLTRLDHALGFRDREVHEACLNGWDALLSAQFANGGFPQVWTGPVGHRSVKDAQYPEYEWRTDGRIKNYWDMYTLNDNVCGYVVEALIAAHQVYQDDRYLTAIKKVGDFLVLAQMPEPQTAWAQQYNEEMIPIWARRFEPAAIASDETQEVLLTLMRIYEVTDDKRYLEPIPSAIAYLKDSVLADGRLARFYELRSNRPLYMSRQGDEYSLTYDDSNLPSHYGWKIESKIDSIERKFETCSSNSSSVGTATVSRIEVDEVRRIITELDEEGRWIEVFDGESLVGQPKFSQGQRYLSSKTFAHNLDLLSQFLLSSDEN